MSDVGAVWLHRRNDLIYRVQEVEREVYDPLIQPCTLQRASRCDHDPRPSRRTCQSELRKRVCNNTYHSDFGWRMRFSTIACPLIPFTPVTRATFAAGRGILIIVCLGSHDGTAINLYGL